MVGDRMEVLTSHTRSKEEKGPDDLEHLFCDRVFNPRRPGREGSKEEVRLKENDGN